MKNNSEIDKELSTTAECVDLVSKLMNKSKTINDEKIPYGDAFDLLELQAKLLSHYNMILKLRRAKIEYDKILDQPYGVDPLDFN